MPYEIIGDCVHKKGDQKPMKCYPGDHKKAVAYMRALEANMPANEKTSGDSGLIETASKVMGMLDQKEAGYTPVSIVPGKACSSCLWWRLDSCHIVANSPEQITSNGYCNEHRVATPMAPQSVAPMPVVIVDSMQSPDMTDMQEMALPTTRKGLVDIIRDTFKSLLQAPAQDTSEPAFSVFKAANGQHYWLARHTGKFIDRDGEIIVDKAHEEYVQRVQSGLVPLPELWTRHKRGTKHGQADIVWKSGGFVLAIGHFDDTPEAKHAIRFYEKNAGKIKLSHMFNYPKRAKQGGAYYAYNTVEITTLPDGAEAFPYTSFEEIKSMTLTEKDREWIRDVGGDEMLKRAEAADVIAPADTKALEANGVEHKSVDNFTGATIPADKGEVEALKVVQSDIETRLKAMEGLPAQLSALTTTIKALTEQVSASQTAENAALEKVNALEKRLTELNDLKPPASQSKDTLLSTRELSFLDQVMTQAKTENSPSLVERMVGGQPAVATGA